MARAMFNARLDPVTEIAPEVVPETVPKTVPEMVSETVLAMTVDPVLQWVVALGLAVLFVAAAWHKYSAPKHFEAQLAAYDLLPQRLLQPFATALPCLELATALGLLLVPMRPLAGASAAALLSAYAGGIALNLLRGRRDIDCGCGGPPQPLAWGLVLRNLVLAMGAMSLVLPTTTRAIAVVDLVLMGTLVGLLCLTYAAVGQVFRNAAALRGWSAHES